MNSNNMWPFGNNKQVHGMKLPEYLTWATGSGQHEKKLLLPPIQRGFVWKPKQIVDLWDSLFRGMPIGSLMLSKLSAGQEGSDLSTKETKDVIDEAMGLLDGQQRTLAMLIGWPSASSSQHCLWIDLAEQGHAGSPFEIRLTTQAQPFGFQRISQSRLSRHERREARKIYDKSHSAYLLKPDYELLANAENEQPRPWKPGNKPGLFIRVKDAWEAFEKTKNNESEFINDLRSHLQTPLVDATLSKLHVAFTRIESLEVPLILIPEHISVPRLDLPSNVPDPLVLLFERIGRNGASLSAEDLLFSMIKQQWPKAQNLVNHRHGRHSVGAFMGATDYVMTAFRLAAAESGGNPIADNPRPNPNDFHRHLDTLLGKDGETNRPLRNYLKDDGPLTSAFDMLFKALLYQNQSYKDIGLPSLMLPHLSRGLIQVLLRWFMRNPDPSLIEVNRQKIISFSLFWYLNIWHEDKASKMSFEIINHSESGIFPAEDIYKALIGVREDEFGLALPLMSYDELNEVLNQDASASLRAHDAIFKKDNPGKPTAKQRELYKRFCWGRKPILLWLQRAYVHQRFGDGSLAQFAGLTDEETVPYDYDHLCPQNHWGADWRNITKAPNASNEVMDDFYLGRNSVGNCIGNLHVLESSLNRSLGDDALASKLKSEDWQHQASLLYHVPEHESLWQQASPHGDEKAPFDVNEIAYKTWDEPRLRAFQSAVYCRALGLYGQYFDACKHIMPKSTSE